MGHVPNAVGRVKRAEFDVAVRINSQGLREREIPYEKPAGVYRILVLGDSQTFGFGVEAEEAYARRLEGHLNPRVRGRAVQRVETLNAGVIGTGTAHQLYYLSQEGWKYRPDAVVVGFFFNDVIENTQCRLYGLRGDRLVQQARAAGRAALIHEVEGRKKDAEDVQVYTAPEAVRAPEPPFLIRHSHLVRFVRERLSNIVQSARRRKAEPQAPASQELGARLFEELARQCRERDVTLVVALIPAPHQCKDASLTGLQGKYGTLLRFLKPSAGSRIAVVDLLPELRQRGWANHFFPLDGHLNRTGHALGARLLAPCLEKLDPRLTR